MSENIRKVLEHNLKQLFSPFVIDFEGVDDEKLSMVIDFVFSDYKAVRELLDYACGQNERMHKKRLDFLDDCAMNKYTKKTMHDKRMDVGE